MCITPVVGAASLVTESVSSTRQSDLEKTCRPVLQHSQALGSTPLK